MSQGKTFSDYHTITRSMTLRRPTNVTQEIWRATRNMLSDCLPAKQPPIRLLGIGVSGFNAESQTQRLLFDNEDHQVLSSLDQATDQIRDKFGASSLGRASGLLHQLRPTPQSKPGDPQSPPP